MTPEQLESKLSAIVENQEANSQKLDTIATILTGNGDPSKGLVVRFDRVEQWWKSYSNKKSKIGIAVVTSLLGFAGSITLLVIRLVYGV